MVGRLKNAEVEKLWKEAVVTSSKIISQNMPGTRENNHENLQDNQSPGSDLKSGSPNTK
jgi:hypothetical protein